LNAYEKHTFYNGADSMPYRLLKPNNFDPTKKYPLVIMLHGEGEGLEGTCSNKSGPNICPLGWGGKMHLDSLNKYPAFILFPQTNLGNWSGGFATGDYPPYLTKPISLLTGLLTQLFQTNNIDLNRVYIHGLCAGGSGVWEMTTRYPHLFAAVSPHVNAGNPRKARLYSDIPIWMIIGEIDNNPTEGFEHSMIDSIRKFGLPAIFTYDAITDKQIWPNPTETGGRPIYTMIPNGGHVVWPYLYDSPVWLKWMFSQNKLNITVYGSTNIYAGDSVKLEVAPGFDAYQWSNGQTSRTIYAKDPGNYQVRMKRKAAFFTGASDWTEWSPAVTVTYKPGTKDKIPPSTPLNLSVAGKNFNSVFLSWNPSTDNKGVAGYVVYSRGLLLDTAYTNSYAALRLKSDTWNYFTVRAIDFDGNLSPLSKELIVKTDRAAFGLNYAYYLGDWTSLPDFSTLSPVKSGYVNNFSLTLAQNTDHYAFKYDGFIKVPSNGKYNFYTTSDDASKLYIDGATVVNNDGLHGPKEKSGTINLTKGKHSISVSYYNAADYAELEVRYDGPGISKKLIPDTILYLENIPDSVPPSIPVNLVSTGKTSKSVSLLWNLSSDDNAVAGYNIYVNGVYQTFTPNPFITMDNLNPNTNYSFTLRAKDGSDNLSGESAPLVVKTDQRIYGVSYSYYEGFWASLPDFTKLTPIKTGSLDNFDISPHNRADNFAFKFDAFIDIPSNGTYHFYTTSDDGSKLYIDGATIVNNDGGHASQERSGAVNLTKGRHAISVTYLEIVGGEFLSVSYDGPGISKRLIPNTSLYLSSTDTIPPTNPSNLISTGKTSVSVDLSWTASTDDVGLAGYLVYVNGVYNAFSNNAFITIGNLTPSTTYSFKVYAKDVGGNLSGASNDVSVTTSAVVQTNGVNYSYYEGTWSSLPDFTKLTPIKTGKVNNFDISPHNRTDHFAFKFDAFIDIPSNGTYHFYTTSDDGSKLYIDGATIVNNDGGHASQERSGAVNLTKGKHAISVTFFEIAGGEFLSVSYDGPGISKRLIPNTSLYSAITDVVPPSNPSNLISTGKSSVSVDLSWTASTDDVGLVGYFIYVNGVYNTSTTNTYITIGNLTPSTTYSFKVYAKDVVGNLSGASNEISVTTSAVVQTNGVNYSYYEGTWSSLPDFTKLTPIKTGIVNNFDISPRNRADNFAFKFDGYIDIPSNGTYHFYTTSDDGSKLFIDGVTIVNNDGGHASRERSGAVNLIKGKHAISVTFFEIAGSEILSVSYDGPGISKRLIPNTSLYPGITDVVPPSNPSNLISTGKTNVSVDLSWTASTDDVGLVGYLIYVNGVYNASTTNTYITIGNLTASTNYSFKVYAKDVGGNLSGASNEISVTTSGVVQTNGVNYSYYEGTWNSVPDFTKLTPIKTGVVNNFDISPRNHQDYFAFKFESNIDIKTGGTYTFYVNSDDGSLLYIGNQLIVNNDGLHAPVEKNGSIYLAPGRYPIMIGYLDKSGWQTLIVSYSGPGIVKQSIPNSLLFRNGTTSAKEVSDMVPTENTSSRILAYPNPFTNRVTIIVNSEQEESETVKIFNGMGEMKYEYTVNLSSGTSDLSIDFSDYPIGIYYLKIYSTNGEVREVVRLVKH